MQTTILLLALLLPAAPDQPPLITDEMVREYLEIHHSRSGRGDVGISDTELEGRALDRQSFLHLRDLHQRLESDRRSVGSTLTFRGMAEAEVRGMLQFAGNLKAQVLQMTEMMFGYSPPGMEFPGREEEEEAESPRDGFTEMLREMSLGGPWAESDTGESLYDTPEFSQIRGRVDRLFNRMEEEGRRRPDASDKKEMKSILVEAAELGVDLFRRDAKAWLASLTNNLDRRGLWRVRLSDVEHRNLRTLEKGLRGGTTAEMSVGEFRRMEGHHRLLDRVADLVSQGTEDSEIRSEVQEAVYDLDDDLLLRVNHRGAVALRELLARGGEARLAALELIPYCGRNAAPLVPSLVPLLAPDEAGSLEVELLLSCLAAIGPAAADASPRVLEIFRREEGPSVFLAARALVRIGGGGLKGLSRQFLRESQGRKLIVLRALGDLVDEDLPLAEGASALLGVGLRDADPEVRMFSAQVLCEHDDTDRRILPALRKLISEGDENVQGIALSLVYEMGEEAAPLADALVDLLSDRREDHVAESALEALGEMGPRAGGVLPRLRKLSGEGHPLRRTIDDVIRQIQN